MNEEFQSKALDYLERLEGAVENGGMFVAEQAPFVVQEYLAWVFYSNLLGMFVFIVLSVLGVVASVRVTKATWDESLGMHPVCTFAWIGVVVLSCMAFVSAYSLLQVVVAPRVVLLEKLSTLMQ